MLREYLLLIRGADHRRAKSRTVVTFLHKYLRLSLSRIHSDDVCRTQASIGRTGSEELALMEDRSLLGNRKPSSHSGGNYE